MDEDHNVPAHSPIRGHELPLQENFVQVEKETHLQPERPNYVLHLLLMRTEYIFQ